MFLMQTMKASCLPTAMLIALIPWSVRAQETEVGQVPTNVAGQSVAGELASSAVSEPADSRLGPLKDLNGYFPFQVPSTRAGWQQRSEQLRRQVMVATGVWPLMPKQQRMERYPLNAVLHGRVERDGFTVEKVYFESLPNHFVTGLLFRPTVGDPQTKRPAVLCPHGHGGRMQDYGADKMADLIASGAEKYERSGRFPKIARCAQLARMGCVAFIFDMLGYEDSQQISDELAHRFRSQRPEFEGKESWGLYSAQAEMRLQSIMGLQTWNSIRCLDFLEQLPDVDGSRIGVTGGSGGGTQTILLCAIDERPVVAFPNGMVSTAMQGGCTCENCCLLRIGTGNVELAALFAPKPQAMTAADDWTKEMMEKGYPELQQLYGMLGVRDQVYCRPLLQFPHNYNYASRETMYAWFNEHLGLGLTDWEEQDFAPLTKEEASVWNAEHPRPAGGEAYERELTRLLAEQAAVQLADLLPSDPSAFQRYDSIVGGAFRTIVGRGIPRAADVTREKLKKEERDGYYYFEDVLRIPELGEQVAVTSLYPLGKPWNGQVVLWANGMGTRALYDHEGQLRPKARQMLDAGASLVCADLFLQGKAGRELATATKQRSVDNPREAAAYTFCYNDTLFTQRVHDLLTLISFIANDEHASEEILLVGTGGAGPIAACARMIAGDVVDRAVIDTQGFRFEDVVSYLDPDFLPGAVKYGDLPALLALNAPRPLHLVGESSVPSLTKRVYQAARAADSIAAGNDLSEEIDWLIGSGQ